MFIRCHKVGLFAALETHIKKEKIQSICSRVFPHLSWWGNYDSCFDGRIVIFWNPDLFEVNILRSSSQVVHCDVVIKCLRSKVLISFVYGYNEGKDRLPLWQDLIDLGQNSNVPWMCLGDFNAILSDSDRISRASPNLQDIDDFRQCLSLANLVELPFIGPKFSWSNKQLNGARIWSKIDRVLGNLDLIQNYPKIVIRFLDSEASDHTPTLVNFRNDFRHGKSKPFKFLNSWLEQPSFASLLSQSWSLYVEGCYMFKLVKKLKFLKSHLKHWHRTTQSHKQSRIKATSSELATVQAAIMAAISVQDTTDSTHSDLFIREADLLKKLQIQKKALFLDLKQRAKIEFINCNDENSKYFFARIAERRSFGSIFEITDHNNLTHKNPEGVQNAFVDFFSSLFGKSSNVLNLDSSLLQEGPFLSDANKAMLSATITREEIKSAIFAMHSDKSPGPDGFSPGFFKNCWDIIGEDFYNAIEEFFRTGKILREINATFITLIPKTINASKVGDFRPISLCNVVYKTITKIMANRIKKVIGDIVGPEQGAFVPGRHISDNISLAHELVKNYNRKWLPSSACIKVDIRKAFDSVSWDFIKDSLLYFGFPLSFVNWILSCISSSTFSVLINGEPHGFFEGEKGLRQGDPLSPYLFVLCMEILSRLLRKLPDGNFEFHPRCKRISLTHLIFADDLLLFTRGNFKSVAAVHSALATFANWSGLHANSQKTGIYFGGVDGPIMSKILKFTQFKREKFPFRYLGLPLNSSRLTLNICSPLLDSIHAKTSHWATKFLSYAGRLQLINSVIFGLINFWGSSFLLPGVLLKEVERLCRRFFWDYGDGNRKIIMFSWNNICKPKLEGGFNVKELLSWNKALMCKKLSKISSNSGIWANWSTAYYLSQSDIWEVRSKKIDSWAWKKLLEVRDEVIGASWDSSSSFSDIFSSWFGDRGLSLAAAYSHFRGNSDRVYWAKVVWEKEAIPAHSVISVLALHNALLTYDNLRKRGVVGANCCLLCLKAAESSSHLFFSCQYSKQVISSIKDWAKINTSSANVRHLLWVLSRHFKSKSWKNKLAKVAIIASVYMIWKERNSRIFKNRGRSPAQLVRKIKYFVSVRMISCVNSLCMDDRMKLLLDS